MKNLLFITIFLITCVAMAQTTVTLEDQCNCEVLSGTAVTAAGMTTPGGADIGDIYVNTNTGTIYFWDGGAWRLTSSDSQQLQGFTFDPATNLLTLGLQNGGTVSVNLSDLQDSFTDTNTTNDRIEVIGSNLVITDSEMGTVSVPLSDIVAGVDTNTTISTFEIDATNTNLVITDSDTNRFTIALADIANLVNTDNQNLSEVLAEGADANGAVITNLGAPVAGSDAVTKTYVDAQVTGVSTLNDGQIYVGDATNTATGVTASGDATITNTGVIDLTNNAVQTDEINDLAVTRAKIAADAIDNTKIADQAVQLENIANGTADGQVIQWDAGTSSWVLIDLSSVTVTETDGIIGNEVTGVSNGTLMLSGAGDAGDPLQLRVATGGIDTNELADEAVTLAKLANGTADGQLMQWDAGTSSWVLIDVSSISDDDISVVTTVTGGNTIATISEPGITDVDIDETVTTLDDADSDGVFDYVSEDGTTTSFDGTDNQNMDDLNTLFNTGTGALTVAIENGSTATADLSSLQNQNTDNQNLGIGTGGVADQSVEVTISGGSNALVDIRDGDFSDTNEIQNLGEVLADGNNAAGLSITGLADPTGAQDAATKAYVDGLADDDVSVTNTKTGSRIATISEPGITPVDINETVTTLNDADSDGVFDYVSEDNTTTSFDGTDDQTAAQVTYDNADSGLASGNVKTALDELDTEKENIANKSTDTNLGNSDTDYPTQNAVKTYVDAQVNGATTLNDGQIFVGNPSNTATGVTASGDATISNTGVIDLSDDAVETNEIADLAVTNAKIGADAIDNTKLADDAVRLENIADGTLDGQVIQWDAGTSEWTLVDLGSVTVTENDGIVGNEVTGVSNGTLTLSGAGSTSDPLQLRVSAGGIDTNELADESVTLAKLADGTTDGQLMQWDATTTSWILIDVSSISDDDVSVTNTTATGNRIATISEPGITPVDVNESITTLSTADNTTYTFTSEDDTTTSFDGTDDQDADEVDIDDAGNNFTATEVEGALAELAGRADADTQYTAGNGLALDGSNEFTADVSIAPGNAISVDADGLFATDTNTEYTAGNGLELTGTEFSAEASPDTGNALEVRANGLYATDTDTQLSDSQVATAVNSEFPDLDTDSTDDFDGEWSSLLNVPAGFADNVDNVDDADSNPANEIQNIEEVLTDGNNANGLVLTGLGAPTAASDAATKAYVDALDTNDQDLGIGTGGVAGQSVEVTITDGASATVDVRDGDSDATNERNTAFAVANDGTQDVLRISDSGGNLDVPLSNIGSDDQDLELNSSNILSLTNDVTTVDLNPYVNDDTNELTDLSLTGNTLTLTNPATGTNSVTLPGADGTETRVTAGTDISVTGDGSSATPYVIASTFTENTTNELQDLNLTGDNLTLSNDPTATPIDLSDYTETVVGTNDITVTSDGAGNYTVDYVDGDMDPTNELTTTGTGGPSGTPANGTTYVDTDTGQLYVYDGIWQQVGGSATPAADIVTTLSSADNITYTYTSENNTTTSFDGTDDQNASQVAIADGANNFTSSNVEDALAELAGNSTDDQDADEVPIDDTANNFTATEVEGALAELAGRTDNDTQYTAGDGLDLTGTVFSADISTTAGNALTIDADGLYVSDTDNVDDADANPANEIQNIEEVLADGNDANGRVLTGLGAPTAASDAATKAYVDALDTDDADSNPSNEIQTLTSTDGSVTLTNPLPNDYNLSVNFPANNDNSATNELSDLDLTGDILTLTNRATPTNQVDLSPYLNTDDQDADEVGIDDAGNNFAATEVEGALAELAGRTDDDVSITNTVTGNRIATISEPGITPVDIAETVTTLGDPDSDGVFDYESEDGTTTSFDGTDDQTSAQVTYDNSGSGLTAVNVKAALDELDSDITDSELTTTVVEGPGTDVAASVVDNNTQYTVSAEISTTAGNALTIDADGLYVSDTDNDTQYTAGNGLDLTGTIFSADVSTNAGNALTIDGDGLYVPDTDNVDDADANPTNEIQNIEEVLADGNDANGLVLTGLGAPTAASDAATKAYVDALDTNDQDLGIGTGGVAGQSVEVTITDGASATVDVRDGDFDATNERNTALVVANDGTQDVLRISDSGGNLDVPLSNIGSDDQTAGEVTVADSGNNFTTDNVEAALAELAGRTDADTQYTAGDGLDLTGTIFSADISTTAGNALTIEADGLYVSDTDNVDDADSNPSNEIQTLTSTDGSVTLTNPLPNDYNLSVNFPTNNDNSATNELSDLDLTGDILTLTNRATPTNQVDLSPYLNTDNQVISSTVVTPNQTVNIALVRGGDTTIDIRDGDSSDTNEIQTAAQVTYDNSGSGLTAGNVEAALDELDGRTDADTQYTAGNGLDLTGTVFSADVSTTAGNALTIDGDGLYVPDTDNVDDADANPTNEIQNIEEVLADGNDANGLVLTGLGTPTAASDAATKAYVDALDTDDQDLGIGTGGVAGQSVEVTITDGTSATVDVRDGDSDATNERNTAFAVANDGTQDVLRISDSGGNLDVPLSDIGSDDQDADEVNIDDAGNNFTATEVEGALAELAGRTDDDVSVTNTVTGNRIATISEPGITSVDIAETVTTLSTSDNIIYTYESENGTDTSFDGTDDQTAAQVTYDNTDSGLSAGDVKAALDELDSDITDSELTTTVVEGPGTDVVASVVDNNTQYTVSAEISSTADNALSIAADGLYVTDNDTQYTAGDGLDLTGTEFSADISTNAGNALNIDGDGLYATDDQDADEVNIDDSANNFTATEVEGALAELAASNAADNDTDATNERNTAFSVANDGTRDVLRLTDSGGDLDVPLSDIGSDDQNAGEVTFNDAIATLGETDVQGAIEALAGRTDADTQYTAGNGLDLVGTVFSADVSTNAGNALSIDGDGLYVPAIDGSETVLDNGTNTVVNGSGTSADPYTVDVPDNTDSQDLRFTGGEITLTGDPDNTVIDLSGYDTDATDDFDGEWSSLLNVPAGFADDIDNVDDADSDPANERNTAFAVANNGTQDVLRLTDSGGDLDVPLSSIGSDDQQLDDPGTEFDAGTGALTVALENGGTATADLSSLQNQNTDDQTASEVTYDNTDSNLSAINVKAALDELDADIAASNTADADRIIGNEVTNTTNGTLTRSGTGTAGSPYTLGVSDGGINTTQLANNAVTSAKIANNAVTTAKIADNAVTNAKIANNAVTTTKIASGGNDKVLTTGATGTVTWADKSTLNTDNQAISSTVVTPNQTVNIALVRGGDTDIDIRDGDSSDTNEIQTAAEVNYDNTDSGLSAGNVKAALDELDGRADNNTNLATDNLTQDAETRTYDMNGEDLNFNNGSFGVGTTNPSGTFEARSALNQDAFYFVQEEGLFGEKDVFTIEDQDRGGGGQSHSSILKVFKNNDIFFEADGFSLVELTSIGTDPGANKYWISGRKVDEGAPLWGVDINDNDFWSEGGITLGAIGAADGTYSGGNFRVNSNGDTGIGTTSPDARLDVEGGTVRFSDYGAGTINGTETFLLGVEADGDVIEVNAANVGTDDQFDDEVELRTPIDVDDAGKATVTNETNVQEVIEAIAPITSKAARIFYPPSIAVDASSSGTGRTINLYSQYTAQFATPAVASAGAPAAIPTYSANELYYYVTEFDTSVFANVSVSATGIMTYDVIAQPADYNSLINVVFVVK
ncbi:MAG: hypothetical protein WA913_05685 [Pricia sp.]